MDEQQKLMIKNFLESKGYTRMLCTPNEKNSRIKTYGTTFLIVDKNKVERIKKGHMSFEEKQDFDKFKSTYFAYADSMDTFEDMLEDYCATMCSFKDGDLYISDGEDYICFKKEEINTFIKSNENTLFNL